MTTQTTIILKYVTLRRRMMNAPYRYTERQVLHTVWRLVHTDPEIQRAFVAWFQEGTAPRLKYAGVSFADLCKYKHMNEFNAFLFMDELKRDPDAALNMLVANIAPVQTLKPEELRPELREYVAGKLKEQEADAARQKEELQLHDDEVITFKLK